MILFTLTKMVVMKMRVLMAQHCIDAVLILIPDQFRTAVLNRKLIMVLKSNEPQFGCV